MALTSRWIVRLAACLAAAACGGGHDAAPPASTGGAQSSAMTASAPQRKPACARTGHWSECQVFARLEQAGVAPRRDGTLPDLPTLGPRPVVYTIGTVGVAVYLFPDTLARARAARSLDTLHFIAPSADLSMRGEATAIQNDNLLVLLYSRNDTQRERVSNALQAGAPQP